jgi:hypothetical protein
MSKSIVLFGTTSVVHRGCSVEVLPDGGALVRVDRMTIPADLWNKSICDRDFRVKIILSKEEHVVGTSGIVTSATYDKGDGIQNLGVMRNVSLGLARVIQSGGGR